MHATRHIQSHVGDAVRTKFCPKLTFHQDDKFKKTLEIMNLIDEASSEYAGRDVTPDGQPVNPPEADGDVADEES